MRYPMPPYIESDEDEDPQTCMDDDFNFDDPPQQNSHQFPAIENEPAQDEARTSPTSAPGKPTREASQRPVKREAARHVNEYPPRPFSHIREQRFKEQGFVEQPIIEHVRLMRERITEELAKQNAHMTKLEAAKRQAKEIRSLDIATTKKRGQQTESTLSPQKRQRIISEQAVYDEEADLDQGIETSLTDQARNNSRNLSLAHGDVKGSRTMYAAPACHSKSRDLYGADEVNDKRKPCKGRGLNPNDHNTYDLPKGEGAARRRDIGLPRSHQEVRIPSI